MSSEAPLFVADEAGGARRRRPFARQFGLPLLLVSGVAIAVVLSPAFSSGDEPRHWQSARR